MSRPRIIWRRELIGLVYLAPGLAGLIVFTLIPLITSLLFAFTNWDVRLHNPFRDGEIMFTGLDNLTRMVTDPRFWRYLGNTLFLMLAIPVAVAGSLGAALLLSAVPARGAQSARPIMLASLGLVLGATGIMLAGGSAPQIAGLLLLLFAGLLAGGAALGGGFYRTIFYLPHFTAGIATYLLWKKALQGEHAILNQALLQVAGTWRATAALLPDWGWLILAGGLVVGSRWCWRRAWAAGAGCLGLAMAAMLMLASPAPAWVPPNWLGDYHWAKPALMMVSVWVAVGSNNMLLYLAGIASVPRELTEAAALDGANAWQRFRHVTWPQLAPITFFIVTMSVIGGFQGGFEMARAMTDGGPAGSTTTLAYFIFNQGFEDGDLGYASALAWAMFVLIGAATWLHFRWNRRNG